jgi:hypothetical protein
MKYLVVFALAIVPVSAIFFGGGGGGGILLIVIKVNRGF